MLKTLTNGPSTICRNQFWNSSISLRNSRRLWPKIETRCSYKIVLIKTNRVLQHTNHCQILLSAFQKQFVFTPFIGVCILFMLQFKNMFNPSMDFCFSSYYLHCLQCLLLTFVKISLAISITIRTDIVYLILKDACIAVTNLSFKYDPIPFGVFIRYFVSLLQFI